MEQMTPVLSHGGDWNPKRELSRPYGESHDDDNEMEFQYGSLLRVWTHFDGTMSSMCNGCGHLSG
jgi:hypothetical protein